MAVAGVEAISPELVLVCPELRDRALASEPDAGEASVREHTRHPVRTAARPVEAQAESLTRSAVAHLRRWLVYAAGTVIVVVAVTFVLTLIANATR
jgi:hypothetical protein